jgi:RNA polymerase sigma-70 factor (ECF subfamily)
MIEASKYHLTKTDLVNEQGLVEAAKKDPKDFAILYETYYEQIYRYIYLRLDNKEQAFDATQQVFLKAMDNLYKYEYRGIPFASWLYRIAFSEINNLFRQEKFLRTVNIDSVSVYNIIEEIQESKIDHYHDKIVSIISEQLEEDQLQLIEMRFFEKRSFKEIAEILDITENNAKVRTYRVLELLKKSLSGNFSVSP